MKLNDRDQAWIDAMRRYLGDGSEHTSFPVYFNNVPRCEPRLDVRRTLDRFMEMFGIKPVPQPEEKK